MSSACFRLFWFLVVFVLLTKITNASVCRSINARNSVASLKQLENCTVVEGYVMVVLMELTNESDFEPYSFPQLREITHFLLFFRVRGLQSIGKLFPNLEKIGGYERVLDYALIICQMYHLKEIDLASLKEVSRGSVIVYKNQNTDLCYVDTVDWDSLTKRPVEENYMRKNNKYARQCPRCGDQCKSGHCWNGFHCQDKLEETRCHPSCLAGCSGPGPEDCYSCKRFINEGVCVDRCPPNTYLYLGRRCLRKEECIFTPVCETTMPSCDDSSKNFSIFENECLKSCPPGYEPGLESVGLCQPCPGGKCQKVCKGGYLVSAADSQEFRGCTYINGSFEIVITLIMSPTIRSQLEENLGSIEEIAGYLKITRSSLSDLKFFKNLTVIHGKTEDNTALYVLENQNLQELWDWKTKTNLTVLSGRVYFHYNPKLCLQHIYKLLDVIRYKTHSRYEISEESNGDKFPCNASFIDITITNKGSDFIEFHVPFLRTQYASSELRYVVYFTKDPHKTSTMFDDVDQCSQYNWKAKDVTATNDTCTVAHGFYTNLTDLEPDTQYTFYVTTYTVNTIGAKSDLKHEVTLPSTPTELSWLKAFSKSSSEIVLQWEPATQTNGKLEEYVVTWFPLDDDKELLTNRNYCKFPMDYTSVLGEYVIEQFKKVSAIDECCLNRKQPEQVEEGFRKLYTKRKTSHNNSPDKATSSNCETHVNSLVYKPLLKENTLYKRKSQYLVEENLVNSIDNDDQTTKMKFKKNLIHNKGLNNMNINQQVNHLPANSVGTIIAGLQHFRNYVILVKACRAPHAKELRVDVSEDVRCSMTELVTVRTLPDKDADIISDRVHYSIKKDALTISWNPPEDPNGFVVAFEIEYQQRHVDFPNIKIACVTYMEYELKNRKYFIANIAPGKYQFRIRAISLSGKGPFTPVFHFDVVDVPAMEVVFIILAVMMVIGLIFLSLCFMGKQKQKTVIAIVNPNYHYVPDHYEVERKDVEFGQELGVGSFGKVYRGFLRSSNKECAIKTISVNASEEESNEFLCEAMLMKSMSEAFYIVSLVGVVSIGKPPLVLMELMELGDLKTYLRSVRETKPLTNATIIKMAIEIADAMTFMEAHKFVHRDLAARNCMVKVDLTIKVGDFGMARDIYETDYYRKKGKEFLPIRWMAPESLKDGEFTSQADAWSYGVVLWEIVTIAEQPYQGFSNEQVLNDVIAGKRLEIPPNSPLPLKSIMKSSWSYQSSSRPSFMHVVQALEYYHDEEFKRQAYYYTKEAVALRKSEWEYVEMHSVEDPMMEKLHQTNIPKLLLKAPHSKYSQRYVLKNDSTDNVFHEPVELNRKEF